MVENFTIYMTALKQERMIRVYIPKSYNKENKRYPVLYMHDGQNVFRDEDAVGGVSLGLEKYLDQQKLDVIVVAIDLHTEDRMNEYTPWKIGEYSKKYFGPVRLPGGKGKLYVDFLINDLKPYIDKKYRTLVDENAIAGISLGGLISTYAACCYPQVFNKVAVLSSAFLRNQEEIEKCMENLDLSSISSFYLDCGDRESNDDVISRKFVESNERIYKLLKEKITTVRFEVIQGGEHNYDHFKKRVLAIFDSLE